MNEQRGGDSEEAKERNACLLVRSQKKKQKQNKLRRCEGGKKVKLKLLECNTKLRL